jgi:hypothetical protein
MISYAGREETTSGPFSFTSMLVLALSLGYVAPDW